MPLRVNLRHLENRNLTFEGELPAAELDFDLHDDMVRANQPLHYALEVQKLDESLLVRGRVELTLDCQCVRCLKAFEYKLELPEYTSLIPLAGEEAASVSGDYVDLTPFLREDTLLEFPQHPLCKPGCRGLKLNTGKTKTSGAAGTKSDS